MVAHPEKKHLPAAIVEDSAARDLLDKPVSAVMSPDVHALRHELSIMEATHELIALRIHGAPVIDSDGRLVGLVSQTDLLAWHSKRAGASRAAAATPPGSLRDVMTPFAHAVRPETRVSAAAALMIRRRIHRLLVVNEDLGPVGIVTAFDLLQTVPGVSDRFGELGGLSIPSQKRR